MNTTTRFEMPKMPGVPKIKNSGAKSQNSGETTKEILFFF
jgi:hypothetical protein